jgi:hypothetical protein
MFVALYGSDMPRLDVTGFYLVYLTIPFLQTVSFTLLRLILPVSNDDRLCGPVVRVPGYRTEMYCVSCEVRTEFIYVIYS